MSAMLRNKLFIPFGPSHPHFQSVRTPLKPVVDARWEPSLCSSPPTPRTRLPPPAGEAISRFPGTLPS